MIFDDLENDELFTPNNFERTKNSAHSMEFETSLDEILNREQADQQPNQTPPVLYEVFQIQLNERFFNIPLPRKQGNVDPSIGDEPKAKTTNGFELKLKEAERVPDLDAVSLGLSQECDEQEKARNIEAMQQDSFTSNANYRQV